MRPLVKDAVDVRAPIAILSTGSRLDELTRRIDESEHAGQPVWLVCFATKPHDHHDTRADLLHLPRLSLGIASSVLTLLVRQPTRTLRSVVRLLRGVVTGRIPAAAIVHLPAAMHVAQLAARRAVAEVQGEDAVATGVASIVKDLARPIALDLADLPVDWSRLGARQIGVRWFSRRINSVIAEVTLDGDRRVIVKRHRTNAGGPAADRAAREVRTLASLHESMRDGTFSVPRILLFDSDAALVVMERASGATIESLFSAAAADRAEIPALARSIRGAGAWLAAMQRVTTVDADPRALCDEIIAIAIADLAKVATGDRILRRRQREIGSYLEETRRSLSLEEVRAARRHDDYSPANVFFDGERVTVIDFESSRDGLTLEDAAFFLLRCELLLRRFGLDLDAAAAFQQGYGRPLDDEALRLFTVTQALRTLGRGAGEDLPMPQRLWTQRTIRNAIFKAMRHPP